MKSLEASIDSQLVKYNAELNHKNKVLVLFHVQKIPSDSWNEVPGHLLHGGGVHVGQEEGDQTISNTSQQLGFDIDQDECFSQIRKGNLIADHPLDSVQVLVLVDNRSDVPD